MATKKTAAKKKETIPFSCETCGVLACRARDEAHYPNFCVTEHVDEKLLKRVAKRYHDDEELAKISYVSACIEGEYYMKLTRVEETVEFIKRMGYKKVGIASCVGLLKETNVFVRILKAHGIEAYTVGCKIGAIDKSYVGIPDEKKLNKGCAHESMCNPVMQAEELAKEGTEFNIVMGLCVGHDSMFLRYSKVPTTVMVVKDRVLGHNPVQALYTANGMYSRFKQELNIK